MAWFAGASEWPGRSGSFDRSLSQLFDSHLKTTFSRAEAREARRRLPKLASLAAGGSTTAEEIFERQVAGVNPPGSPARGKEIFAKQCASCHRLGSLGGEAGPDLTGVADRLERASLLEAILWPARQAADRYRSEAIELADGSTIEALVVREDDKVMLLKTAREPRPISILKSRIRGRRKLETSIMPEGLLEGYDQEAIAGLLAFLEAAGVKQE